MPRTKPITSFKNPLVHRVRATAAGEVAGQVVADGHRLVLDALEAGLRMPVAVVSDKLTKHRGGFDLRRRLEQRADECFECPDPLLERMSALKTHQGVLTIVERTDDSVDALLGTGAALIVAAAGIRDPGNVGAMIRAAEASGASGFIAMDGGADPFRDKAVRGSSGSVFRVPTKRHVTVAQIEELVRTHELQLVVTGVAEGADYLSVDYTKPTMIVLGGEGAGTPPELEASGRQVRIPMVEPVESLNVAVATGVLLFEARRQRL